MLLMRYGDLYQINTVMLPWSKDWCIPFKSKAASNWTTSYSVSILHSRYSATMLGHYNITHWWYDLLPIFITAPVSTNIRILFSSSAIVPTYRYIESKELVIDIGNFFIRQRKMRKKKWDRNKRSLFTSRLSSWAVDDTITAHTVFDSVWTWDRNKWRVIDEKWRRSKDDRISGDLWCKRENRGFPSLGNMIPKFLLINVANYWDSVIFNLERYTN